MEESLQAAQGNITARDQTVEVRAFLFWTRENQQTTDSSSPSVLESTLAWSTFCRGSLWSNSWPPCRQTWSSWDRRRCQRSPAFLLLTSRNSRLSEWIQHVTVLSCSVIPTLWVNDEYVFTHRLAEKDQAIQALQTELEVRTKEVNEKMEQVKKEFWFFLGQNFI